MNITSESIKEITIALSLAQSKITNVKKDKSGYGYKYADLADCLEMVKQPLYESNLALIQIASITDSGKTVLITMLMHTSGEWIRSVFPLNAQASKQTNEMQALGSGITYLRRYALCAMLGIAQEDDDGAKAAPVIETPKFNKAPEIKRLQELCDEYGVDIKEFANTHNVRSSNIDSIKYAIENFEQLVTR